MNLPPLLRVAPRSYSSIFVAMGQAHEWAANSGRLIRAVAAGVVPSVFLLVTTRQQVYNVLWALVFGFATVNILSLGARRIDPKGGLHFGEVLAILIVLVSIVLLGWELLYVFHILPIRLSPR
jgi:hypothetical protein